MIVLETERLILRKFSCDDWKGVYENLSQETVKRENPFEMTHMSLQCWQMLIKS